MSDTQTEIAAIIAQHELRDAWFEIVPADVLPEIRAELEAAVKFAAKHLGTDAPELLLYERRHPADKRLGFFDRSRPGQVFVAATKRDGEATVPMAPLERLVATAIHETVHKSGIDSEVVVGEMTKDLLAHFLARETPVNRPPFPDAGGEHARPTRPTVSLAPYYSI